jgi:antitoxin HicB
MNQKNEQRELEYYLQLRYPVVIKEDPEGGYTAEIEELSGCMTQAETTGEIFELIEDARKLWIEAAYSDGHEIPLPNEEQQYTGKFIVRIPGSLHRTLVRQAKSDGVSLNQYVTALLAAGSAGGILNSESYESRYHEYQSVAGSRHPYQSRRKEKGTA